jgi:hypothetical protein
MSRGGSPLCKLCTDCNKKTRQKKSFKEKYLDDPEMLKNLQNKKEATCVKKYDVKNPFQYQPFKEKGYQTMIEKCGETHIMKTEAGQSNYRSVCKERCGYEYPSQSPECKAKVMQTCLKNNGVEHPSQSPEIMEKMYATNLKRHGKKHAMQNPEIAERSAHRAYCAKDYKMPSGTIIKVQGFEPYALNYLLETYAETDIVTGCKNVPIISYTTDDGKKHVHYVDIWIPSQNLMIEVKSTWTISKNFDKVLLKKQAALDAGYKYEIWVYDKKGKFLPNYDTQFATSATAGVSVA